jgi:hypothetical protein
MEENNQVIIDIGIDALIASLRELQKQYEANTAAMKALRDEGKQDSDEYIQLAQANKVLRQEMGGVEKSIQNNIKAEKAQEGSLVQLRAQLANLNKQYDSMSGFERMGTAGEELRKKIKALSDNISGLEANTGRYQRNVGNYKSALEGLSGSFKLAGLSTKGLDQSLKLLNGNPIMLLLTAIVTIGRQLIQAFKGNEEATMALKQAFSAFNPLIDAAKRGLEAFANVVVKVVTGAVNGLTSAIGWLLDRVQDIGDFFGADWHMGDNFREGVAAAKELQAAENDYIKAKRAWSVESAKIDREVADLREKASDKENYTAQQRLDYLNKAIALETRKAEKDKELAQQNLANLQAEAQRSANDAAMNEKLAEAERAVIEADTRLADTKRNLNRQRQQSIREINGEASAVGNYTAKVKELRKELELIKALSIDELTEANTKKNKELADNIKQVVDRIGLLDETFEKLPSAEELFGDLAEVTDENLKDTTTSFELFSEGFKNNAETIEQTASALSSSFGSVASMYETMAKDESKSEAEREKAARKAKTWAALQIAANSGTALAKGIAGAMDVPWPANIGALASIMATVLAAIAQAKALAAESHEHGGVIGGKFIGATRGGDDTYIHARRGELMLNADQQRQLYDIANGNTKTNMAAQLAEAIQAMPAPVLVYEEFSRFGQKIVNINELTQLQ